MIKRNVEDPPSALERSFLHFTFSEKILNVPNEKFRYLLRDLRGCKQVGKTSLKIYEDSRYLRTKDGARKMNCGLIFLVISTFTGIYIGILMQRPVSSLCDSGRCPFCYGIDLCEDIDDKRINLRYKSFSDVFYNLFSVKNLFFAEYDGVGVILKKLGHKSELEKVTYSDEVTEETILDFLNNSSDGVSVNSLKICSREVSESFLESLKPFFQLEQIWTILQVNVEPLMLTLLRNGFWPVPKLYGACGFLIVEEYCGLPLNHFQAYPWHTRAFLALQLLEAAIDFTHKHNDFRVYLTDISLDNIVVDDNFVLYFVDLENVIIKEKTEDDETIHYSEFFPEEEFVYNDREICQSPVSDHNVYAVCKLLLSRRAPWPMMPNGLLHSPPSPITASYKELFSLVEECVDSEDKLNRFHVAKELIRLLRAVNQ